jgi:hypothetical protein
MVWQEGRRAPLFIGAHVCYGVVMYSLHPIISVFLEFKIYPKISARLVMGPPNFSCLFLLSLLS